MPLKSGLNNSAWCEYVDLYHDPGLPEMLQHGFPCGHLGRQVPAVKLVNHASARRNPLHVEKYLTKELSHNTMVGSFSDVPFEPWFRNNPLMTRLKRESDELRVILDLSFPLGESINSGIARDNLDGSPFKLRLPSPLDLARMIVREGPGCLIYKIDLSRAYRQLWGDPP